MLKFEAQNNLVQHSNKSSCKNYFLTSIRELASSGNFFSLFNFIERSIPNVRIKSIKIYYISLSFFHI